MSEEFRRADEEFKRRQVPEQKILDEYKTAKERVLFLLDRYPATREIDAYLVWLYLKFFNNINLPFLEFSKFYDFNTETITRARRLIQNDPVNPRFQPTQEEVRRRRRRQEAMRTVMPILKYHEDKESY